MRLRPPVCDCARLISNVGLVRPSDGEIRYATVLSWSGRVLLQLRHADPSTTRRTFEVLGMATGIRRRMIQEIVQWECEGFIETLFWEDHEAWEALAGRRSTP